MDYSQYKVLLFDLDGTLLNSKKYIYEITVQSIMRCKEKGFKIGICTSRSEVNSLCFVESIHPEIIISSGGALVNADGKYISKHEFSVDETREIILKLRSLIGEDCEITVDTVKEHYWNYKTNPNLTEANWGDSVYSDFHNFQLPALKICVEIKDESKADAFYACFDAYDCIRFSDGNWYKITKRNITKENAIRMVASYYGVNLNEIISFGDDLADIGMLKMCGLGVAMGNALECVKENADIIIGSNDEDGIARFLDGK